MYSFDFPSIITSSPILVIGYCDLSCSGVRALHSLQPKEGYETRFYEIQVKGVFELPSLAISSKSQLVKPIQAVTIYDSQNNPLASLLTLNCIFDSTTYCLFINSLLSTISHSTNIFVLSSLSPSVLHPFNKKRFYFFSPPKTSSPPITGGIESSWLNSEVTVIDKDLTVKDSFLSSIFLFSTLHSLLSLFIFVEGGKISWRTNKLDLEKTPKDLASICCKLFNFLEFSEKSFSEIVIHNTELQDEKQNSNIYL